jgi:hypothetical protein
MKFFVGKPCSWAHDLKCLPTLVTLPDGCKDSSIATAINHVLHGEAGSANQEGIELARRNLRLLLREGGHGAENVYNQDESGAFWR